MWLNHNSGARLGQFRPSGDGKSLLASAMPGILPRLTDAEKVQLAKIYSAYGALRKTEYRVGDCQPTD